MKRTRGWCGAAALLVAALALVASGCGTAADARGSADGGAAIASAGTSGAPAPPASAGSPAAGTAASAEAERIARDATWAPGQLQAHFQKHGAEGGLTSQPAYDASARETIRIGRPFTYLDRESRARRRGFYDPASNRFTAATQDGKRITTHFRPDSGERYVRGLAESTYR